MTKSALAMPALITAIQDAAATCEERLARLHARPTQCLPYDRHRRIDRAKTRCRFGHAGLIHTVWVNAFGARLDPSIECGLLPLPGISRHRARGPRHHQSQPPLPRRYPLRTFRERTAGMSSD